jgi:hypothetical protein
MQLDTLYTANRLDAEHHQAQLEQARASHEASAYANRPRMARYAGALLSRAGAWLQGMPPVTLGGTAAPPHRTGATT